MKRLILAALAVMTLFAGDTLAQTRPVGAPPAAPQAAASAPEQPAQPAQAVTDTMIANCLNATFALSDNAAFAASPRTQPVGARLKLAPCAGGETVRLRTAMRVDNETVHDSAWRQVADALQTRATAAAQPRAEAPAPRPQPPAAEPAQAESDGSKWSWPSFFFGVLAGGLIVGLFTVWLVNWTKRNARRNGPSQIGPGGEVTPRQPSAIPDDVALPGRTFGHGQPEDSAPPTPGRAPGTDFFSFLFASLK